MPLWVWPTNEVFDKRADELSKYLVALGYRERFVPEQIRKAKLKTREEALTPVLKKPLHEFPW